jgi:hypothetical protein
MLLLPVEHTHQKSEKEGCMRERTEQCWQGEHQVRTPASVSAYMWRRIMGATLVLALVFQGLLFGSVNGALAAAGAKDWPAFELCRHEADTSPAPVSGLPLNDNLDCSRYCSFCLAAGNHIFAAPDVAVTVLSFVVSATRVWWSLAEWHFPPRTTSDLNSRPRGPPLTA